MEEKVEKDSLATLFESMDKEIFNEEVQLKIATLFESVIAEAVEVKEKELDEKNEEDIKLFKEELVTNTDEYLNYFITQYIKENEVVVEDFAKVKLAEKVLRNFGQMVDAFNMSLSEESIKDETELEELKLESNKLHNQLIESRKDLETVKRAALIAEASIGGTDLQIEKLVEASKAIEFESEDIFESKLDALLEKIIKEDTEVVVDKLTEEVENVVVPKVLSESMKGYMKYLKKK